MTLKTTQNDVSDDLPLTLIARGVAGDNGILSCMLWYKDIPRVAQCWMRKGRTGPAPLQREISETKPENGRRMHPPTDACGKGGQNVDPVRRSLAMDGASIVDASRTYIRFLAERLQQNEDP